MIKKCLLVILDDYDCGYSSSVVVVNQNFDIIENVPDNILNHWFDGFNWNFSEIKSYLSKYDGISEIRFLTFSDGALCK